MKRHADGMTLGNKNPNWRGGALLFKERQNKRKQQQRRDKPIKDKAQRELYKAVKCGKLRPSSCEVCKTSELFGVIEGHHQDYTKPLDVNWLCVDCHSKVHQAVRAIRRTINVCC